MSPRRNVQQRPAQSALTTRRLTVRLSRRRSASKLTRQPVLTTSLPRRAPLVPGTGMVSSVGRLKARDAASPSLSKSVQISTKLSASQRLCLRAKQLCPSRPTRNALNSRNLTATSPRSKYASWVTRQKIAQSRRLRSASM